MAALHGTISCSGGSSRVLRIKEQMGVHRGPGSPTGWSANCDGRQIIQRSNRREGGRPRREVGLVLGAPADLVGGYGAIGLHYVRHSVAVKIAAAMSTPQGE